MYDKKEIRQRTLARRASLDRNLKASLDAVIRRQIEQSEIYRGAACVAMYFPIHGEVDLLPLWMSSHKMAVFPRVEGNILVFCPARSLTDFAPGTLKIHEPQTPPVCIDSVDLILVPGLIFDHFGYRLGYGMGFYDRLIKAHPAVTSMGVCQDEFYVDKLPEEPWDARMKYVATQSAIYKTEGEVS